MRRGNMTGTHPLDGGAVFNINRDADTQRRARIESQLAKWTTRFSRVPAVEGATPPPSLRVFLPPDTRLTPSEIGCCASHLKAARPIVERNSPFGLWARQVLRSERFLQRGRGNAGPASGADLVAEQAAINRRGVDVRRTASLAR